MVPMSINVNRKLADATMVVELMSSIVRAMVLMARLASMYAVTCTMAERETAGMLTTDVGIYFAYRLDVLLDSFSRVPAGMRMFLLLLC
jgi:hypothetical protein